MPNRMKRGSIDLARRLCYEIAGPTDETDDMSGSGYGSVDIAEILSAEVERLRDILRIDPGRLEIRMSIDDLHIKQFIPKTALDRAGSPRGIVEQHAALMFSKLEAEMAKKYDA